MVQDCPFCDMASGKKEYHEVLNGHKFLAVMDYRPVSTGHVIIFSKEHYFDIYDIPENILKDMMVGVKIISLALRSAYNPPGLNVIQNNGPLAGQTEDHFHIHIIPRYDNSYLKYLIEVARRRKIETPEKLEREAEKIRKNLQLFG